MKRLRLDLGSGPHPRKGFRGVDLHCGPERVDLSVFPWPWADGSVDEVWSSHFVEHLTSLQWIGFVDELHRILKPGGRAVIVHPALKSARSWQDPTHLDHIPAERWQYVSREWRAFNDLDHPPYPTCDFAYEVAASFAPGWEHRTPEACFAAASLSWDVVLDLQVTLTKAG